MRLSRYLRRPNTATNGPAWISSGTPWSRRFAKRITARWALCQVSNGSSQARDQARSRPFSSVRGTAGCRAAHNRQRLSVAGWTTPTVASVEIGLNRASHFLIFCRSTDTPETTLRPNCTNCRLILPFCTYCHFMLPKRVSQLEHAR